MAAPCFPIFHGREDEDTGDFLEALELAHIFSGMNSDKEKLKIFPLRLRENARSWYESQPSNVQRNLNALQQAFSLRFGKKDALEDVWERLQQLQQRTVSDYYLYEAKFLDILSQLDSMCAGSHRMPDMLIKEAFINGTFHSLQHKVRSNFPNTFEDALQIARIKHRKLMYSLGMVEKCIEPDQRMVRRSQTQGNLPASPMRSSEALKEEEDIKAVLFKTIEVVASEDDNKREQRFDLKNTEKSMIKVETGNQLVNNQQEEDECAPLEDNFLKDEAKKVEVHPIDMVVKGLSSSQATYKGKGELQCTDLGDSNHERSHAQQIGDKGEGLSLPWDGNSTPKFSVANVFDEECFTPTCIGSLDEESSVEATGQELQLTQILGKPH